MLIKLDKTQNNIWPNSFLTFLEQNKFTLDPSLICSTKLQHGAALTFGFCGILGPTNTFANIGQRKLRTHTTVRQKPKMGKVNVATVVATVVDVIIKNKLCKHAKGKLFNFEATSAQDLHYFSLQNFQASLLEMLLGTLFEL